MMQKQGFSVIESDSAILQVDLLEEQDTLVLILKGKFESTLIQEFKKVLNQRKVYPQHYLLDFHACSYIDSDVVSFFLEFCQRVKNERSVISIINMNDDAFESFRLLNLHKFFKPEYCPERHRVDWVYAVSD